MKSLYLILFLSVTLHCNGQEDEVFTTIFSARGKVFIGSSNKLEEAKILTSFERYATSLVIYKNYLYISLSYRYRFLISDLYSAIWRIKFFNSTSIATEDESWEEIGLLNDADVSILSMVAVNDFIYAGCTDGKMWRCAINEKYNCTIFNRYDVDPIIAVDYYPGDGKMYAAINSGSLRRFSPNFAYRYEVIQLQVKAILTMKINFNALWLLVKKENVNQTSEVDIWLMKCPISKMATEFDENSCEFFKQLPDCSENVIGSIDATDRYLYFNIWNDKRIYRCDPAVKSSCSSILMPNEIQKVGNFIII